MKALKFTEAQKAFTRSRASEACRSRRTAAGLPYLVACTEGAGSTGLHLTFLRLTAEPTDRRDRGPRVTAPPCGKTH
jgi:hypothetical protein